MMARQEIRLCANNNESFGLKRVWKVQTLKFFSAYRQCLNQIFHVILDCDFVRSSAKFADPWKKRQHHFFQMVSSLNCIHSLMILLLKTSGNQIIF
jgi:hypothetical protein